MQRNFWKWFCASVGAAMALSACGVADGTPPDSSQIVEMHVDGPYYSTVAEVAEAADVLVEVRISESRAEKLLPDYESEDPKINPFVGAEKGPSEADIESATVPVTIHKATIVESWGADVEAGQVIEIMELGGKFEPVTYNVAGVPSLESSANAGAVLFLAKLDNGQYEPVGIGQGQFTRTSSGAYKSVDLHRPDLKFVPTDLDSLAKLLR